jgi:hypothetical protein
MLKTVSVAALLLYCLQTGGCGRSTMIGRVSVAAIQKSPRGAGGLTEERNPLAVGRERGITHAIGVR